MDLQEEYFRRLNVPAHLIRHAEKSTLILRAREGVRVEWNWLHVNIELKSEPNHPAHYTFTLSANPTIYASADFSHFSYQPTKVLMEQRWEWDQYEDNLSEWVRQHAANYVAVAGDEATFVSWEMFISNYDSWLANFLPHRVIDWLAASLSGDMRTRMDGIQRVENWIKEKYERVFLCWRNIRQNLDQRHYADWLVAMVNGR